MDPAADRDDNSEHTLTETDIDEPLPHPVRRERLMDASAEVVAVAPRNNSKTAAGSGESLTLSGAINRSRHSVETNIQIVENMLDKLDRLRASVAAVLQQRRVHQQFLLWVEEKSSRSDGLKDSVNDHTERSHDEADMNWLAPFCEHGENVDKQLRRLLETHVLVEDVTGVEMVECSAAVEGCCSTCSAGILPGVKSREQAQFTQNKDVAALFNSVQDELDRMIHIEGQMAAAASVGGGNRLRRGQRSPRDSLDSSSYVSPSVGKGNNRDSDSDFMPDPDHGWIKAGDRDRNSGEPSSSSRKRKRPMSRQESAQSPAPAEERPRQTRGRSRRGQPEPEPEPEQPRAVVDISGPDLNPPDAQTSEDEGLRATTATSVLRAEALLRSSASKPARQKGGEEAD